MMKLASYIGRTALVVTCLCFLPVMAAGQYTIGPGDVLEIRFWQENSLDATVTVTQDGMISLDIIGEVEAAGLTTIELEKTIVRQISRYNKAITHAVVRVVEYNSRVVYVTGQVLNPGKFTFEEIPNLWTIINEAGGAAEIGDLSRVVLIRGGSQAGEVEVVNVAALVATGRIEELPKIRPGDTIEVPRTASGLPSARLAAPSETRNVFYVTGAVVNPGMLTYESGLDVLDAISIAGGPIELADLENVKVISKDGLQAQVTVVDLDRFTTTGKPGRHLIRQEDTIIVPRKSRGFLGISSLSDLVTILGAVATSVLIYDRLSDGE